MLPIREVRYRTTIRLGFGIKKVTVNASEAEGSMELQKHLAYNQTNECFLGLDVVAADFSTASLIEWIPALALKPDAGLWLVPFRGIPVTRDQIPLDLIYLDDKCRVIELVEAFPLFRVSDFCAGATSVLALPTQSISSSQTRRGDQLILCVAKDLESRLEQISCSCDVTRAFESATLLPAQTDWRSGSDKPQSMNQLKDEPIESEQIQVTGPVKTEIQNFRSTKNWLKRWWTPDPRRAPRQTSPGLSASFWTGASPEKSHAIRDISSTGMFLMTNERWCPGTVIRMLLTNIGNGVQNPESSICVQSRAVRWGNEGVGLQFVVQDNQKLRNGQNRVSDGANRRELDEFLRQVGLDSTYVPKINVA